MFSPVTALLALAYLFYLNRLLTCITIVALAASIESRSEHIIGRAIVRHAGFSQ